jgi:low temperature requirement protein LtrA
MHSGYGWLTNQAPPNNTHRRILIIVGMMGFMTAALTIPGAFEDTSLDFALAYLFVVLIHTTLYYEVAGKSVLRFAPLNIIGAIALLSPVL